MGTDQQGQLKKPCRLGLGKRLGFGGLPPSGVPEFHGEKTEVSFPTKFKIEFFLASFIKVVLYMASPVSTLLPARRPRAESAVEASAAAVPVPATAQVPSEVVPVPTAVQAPVQVVPVPAAVDPPVEDDPESKRGDSQNLRRWRITKTRAVSSIGQVVMTSRGDDRWKSTSLL